MKRKLLLSDLAALLAARCGVETKEADIFLHGFFELIQTGLTEDKLVKITGFGTFKVVSVSARDSVDVNTGERINIDGHSRITFTPDQKLKELANRPFSHFKTVVIEEGVSDEALQAAGNKIEEEMMELVSATSVTLGPPSVPPGGETSNAAEVDVEENRSMPPVPPKEEKIEEELPTPPPAPEVEALEVPEPIVDAPLPEVGDTTETEEEVPAKRRLWRYIAIGLAALLILGLGYLAGYYQILFPKVVEQKVSAPLPSPQEGRLQTRPDSSFDDSLKRVTTEEPATDKYPETRSEVSPQGGTEGGQVAAEEVSPLPKHPRGNIEVKGQKGVHTLRAGESIEQIALRYYGSKEYAYYIIRYNELQNPNVVYVGQHIRLPQLAVRQ